MEDWAIINPYAKLDMIQSKDFLSAIIVGASLAISVHLLPGGSIRQGSGSYINHAESANGLLVQRR